MTKTRAEKGEGGEPILPILTFHPSPFSLLPCLRDLRTSVVSFRDNYTGNLAVAGGR